jgi:phosphatidylglycerophosphate synthase
MATLAIAWIAVAGLALLGRSTFDLGGTYSVKALAVFTVATLLTLKHVGQHHPFGRFGAANQITTVRVAVVALLAALIGERAEPTIATGIGALCAGAALLDGIDGWIARRMRMASTFGARFDLETDAALTLVLAILVWQHGKAGPWIVGAGLLRYAFVAAGWFLPWMRGPLAPSLRGRAICVVQIAALIVAILPMVSPPLSAGIAAAGLLALGYSFAVDTLWLRRHAALRRTQ